MDSPAAPGSWQVGELEGPAAELHAVDLIARGGRRVWMLEPAAAALVVGSAQSLDDVRADAAAAAGVDVVRRRSGGGAVLVAPGRQVWVDVVIDRDDLLWDDDVGRATWWVGEWWCQALAALGVRAEMHRGPWERTPWSTRYCFAGRGAGELSVGDRKLVGISQRRTRLGCRFQCVAPVRFDGAALCELVVPPPGAESACASVLAGAACGLVDLVESAAPDLSGQMRSALLAALP